VDVVPACDFGLHTETLEGVDEDGVVDGLIVVLLSLLIGREEAEAGVSEIVVDCSAASLPAGQQYALRPHFLVPALFPGVLVAADDDGGTVAPQEQRGHCQLSRLEKVLLSGEVEVDVVARRYQDLHL
jgi:hypothetical protein